MEGALGEIGIPFSDWSADEEFTWNDGAVFWSDPEDPRVPTGSATVAQITVPTGSEFHAVLSFQGKTTRGYDCRRMVQFDEDDYRPVLLNCDYYIIERSALMIEAGVTDKPILYVKTAMPERMTIPVQTIVDTYYQATTLADLTSFIDNVVIPDDAPKKLERSAAFQSVIPDNDGTSGEHTLAGHTRRAAPSVTPRCVPSAALRVCCLLCPSLPHG